MPASEAKVAANRINAQKSTGPKTQEGKAASAANAVKHGLTSRKLIPELEAREIERRGDAFVAELKPTGEVGDALARLAATLSIWVERCVEHENAVLTTWVEQAEANFVPPEGCNEAEANKLREQAGKLALFDSSKEGILARRYEAEARRGFFRALKELRQHEGP